MYAFCFTTYILINIVSTNNVTQNNGSPVGYMLVAYNELYYT